MERGYLYIATGESHIKEAYHSVSSLKRLNPKAHVTLVTNEVIKNSPFDKILQIDFESDNYKKGTFFKVLGLQKSPYKQTFYIDVDTHFIDDCSEVFNLLNYFDLLIAQDPSDNSTVKRGQLTLEGYYPYNTGVIIFNNNTSIKKFFNDWILAFQKNYENYIHDQPAFMDALLSHSLKYYVLPNIYNLRKPAFAAILGEKVKLIHGRMDDFEHIALTLNKHSAEHRVWIPTSKKVIRISKTRRKTREFLRRIKSVFFEVALHQKN